MRKFLAVLMALVLALSMSVVALGDEAVTDIPREESLVFNGQQWGPANNFNLFAMANTAFPVGGDGRIVIYETLYMYNMLTNSNEPLLADGDITWEDDYNIVVKIKPAAKWSDGEKLTSADVVYTYNVANEANGGYYTTWSNIWTYLDKVEAVDELTVRFTLKQDPYNVYMMPRDLANTKILPEHIWAPLEEEFGKDVTKLREYFNDDPVGSGPFKLYFYDATRIVCVRDDNYWGQDASMFGKLTEVKYIVHPIYQDNAAGNLAFSQGEVDVSQQFLPNVWELMETMPVATYLEEVPYHLGATIPSLLFNLERPGLSDVVVRQAIARCLDFEQIAINAMSGYTEDIVPSFFNYYLFEDYIDYEDEELAALRWDTTDVDASRDEANAMLDEAGYADVDGDGWREMPDGSKIEWKAECPYGWSDWNASLEILQESAKAIGLNITTYFPETSVYNDELQSGNFDIAMNSPYPALSVANPWQCAYNVLYSGGVPAIGEIASRDYNRYTNETVDNLIDEAAGCRDEARLKEIYTEIDKIFLTEMPNCPLMYRPQVFHTVYEGYWTGFAQKDDGTNTPPMDCTDGAGIKDLYNITKVVK